MNKKQNSLNFILTFILLISICITYLIAQNSYAKYKNQRQANSNLDIASWNIKLNNNYINTTQNITINPTWEDQNSSTKDKVIAPGSIAYVDIKIDPSEVDVDFKYELTYSIPSTSDLKALRIKSYKINGGSEKTYNEVITGNITKNSTTPTTIRIIILWDDTLSSNETDTYLGKNADIKTAQINFDIRFTQIANN